MAPALGFLGDERAIYSLGCVGHGVSMTHLNGRTLADLALERKTNLTDVWFVNRRMIPWPLNPSAWLLARQFEVISAWKTHIFERAITREV